MGVGGGSNKKSKNTTPVVRKINNANDKGYVSKKLNKEMDSGDTCHVEAILDSLKG